MSLKKYLKGTFKRTNGSRIFLVFALMALVVLFLSSFLKDDKRNSARNTKYLFSAPSQSDIRAGDKKARIIVLEYFDLECPSCRAYDEKGERFFLNKYKEDSVGFTYRHMPLEYLHPHALVKAQVFECAILQQPAQYKTIMSLLYTTPFTSTSSLVRRIEASAGDIDAESLEECIAEDRTKEAMLTALRIGYGQGVSMTPTFVVYKDGIERARIKGSALRQLDSSIEILLKELKRDNE